MAMINVMKNKGFCFCFFKLPKKYIYIENKDGRERENREKERGREMGDGEGGRGREWEGETDRQTDKQSEAVHLKLREIVHYNSVPVYAYPVPPSILGSEYKTRDNQEVKSNQKMSAKLAENGRRN